MEAVIQVPGNPGPETPEMATPMVGVVAAAAGRTEEASVAVVMAAVTRIFLIVCSLLFCSTCGFCADCA
jgi:hypothetical protein